MVTMTGQELSCCCSEKAGRQIKVLGVMRTLCFCVDEGVRLTPHPQIEKELSDTVVILWRSHLEKDPPSSVCRESGNLAARALLQPAL